MLRDDDDGSDDNSDDADVDDDNCDGSYIILYIYMDNIQRL